MFVKILTIDPSGNGITGWAFINERGEIEFGEFQATQWLEHLDYLIKLVRERKPQQIVYENTNYIHKRNSAGLGLFKLLGGIETFRYLFATPVAFLPVSQVKQFYTRLYNNKEQIPLLTYKIGRGNGWSYQGKRLSLHQVDAFLIYYIYKNNGNKKK
ncbi:MAG: hypothetical protein I3273_04145 [Candidatus Moeniiplasma glomeromycotorum]|nr:hypothetical protein [Candidatus Moeniiplasma glomeromycotorum]